MRGFGMHQSTRQQRGHQPGARLLDAPTGSATRCNCRQHDVNFFAETAKEGSAVPVNAQIFVGDYSARSTQIADTNPATVNAGTDATGNLDNTAQFAPTAPGPDSLLPKGKASERWSTYNFVAVAPGYGHRPLQREGPEAGRGPEHHDPHADELRVGGAGRDDHDRRSRYRDEREPRRT